MDALRAFQPPLLRRPQSRHLLLTPNPLNLPFQFLPFRCRSSSSSSSTTSSVVERVMEKQQHRKGSVRLRIRLDHQVRFGEHVAVIGSSKELGSWKERLPMEWTAEGWVREFDIPAAAAAAEDLEFKFVVSTNGRKGLVWEDGGNRVLNLPAEGALNVVCRWNATDQGHVIAVEGKNFENEGGDGGGGGSSEYRVDDASQGEERPSPFVENWQGREANASIMLSNDHRTWDTDGLDGVALKLVEEDKGARNWWRKVVKVMMCSLMASSSSAMSILLMWGKKGNDRIGWSEDGCTCLRFGDHGFILLVQYRLLAMWKPSRQYLAIDDDDKRDYTLQAIDPTFKQRNEDCP